MQVSHRDSAVLGMRDRLSAEGGAHLERLRAVVHAGARVTMLCGDPGTGKTTLLRHLEALEASTHRVVFVPFLHVPAEQVACFLLGWMGHRQRSGDAELRALLETGDRPTLLLIDEAQSIAPAAAARLRAVVSATRADVQIVSAGVPSPELDAALAALGGDCVRLDLQSQQRWPASPRITLAAASAPPASNSNSESVAGTAPSPQDETLSEPTATPTRPRLSSIRSPMAAGLRPALRSTRDGSARIWRWTDDPLAVSIAWIVASARTTSRYVANGAHAGARRWNAALRGLRKTLSNRAAAARKGLGRLTERARDAGIQLGRGLRRQRDTITRHAASGLTRLLVTGVLLGLGGLVIATIPARWTPGVRASHAFAARPLALDAESPRAPRVQSTEEAPQRVEVNINALPWARVRVNGRDLGATPLGAVGLEVGLHEFELQFSSGRTVTYAVEIDPSVLFLSFGADRAPSVTAAGDGSN